MSCNYKTLSNAWYPCTTEKYEAPVTLSLPAWRQYVASGKNTLYGSGGIIPGGTINTGFGTGGAVYRGNVFQGYGSPYGV